MAKLILVFTNFPDAFDYCRECDHPVTVLIDGELWKLYPSGTAVLVPEARDKQYHTLACGHCLPKNEDLKAYMDSLFEHVKQCEKAQKILIEKCGARDIER